MTETSLPWSGTATGDASLAPYTSTQWADMFRKLHSDNRTKSGPIRGYLNEFAATGTTSPITIDTGGAFVDGIFYESDAAENFVLAAPAANPRIDRIVLRKITADQTVRLHVITGAEAASPSKPALTQTNNVTWDLQLWYAWIDTAGNITLFDEYHWAHSPLGDDVGLQQGRLSLLFDDSVPVNEQAPIAPTSTAAGADTVTYAAAQDWNTGQAIQISATTNGLTQDQIYYVRTADNLTYSFHETLHDAKRNLNLVNITGDIQPSTLYSGAIYLTRHNGDSYDVQDSVQGWTRLRIPEDGVMLDITDRATFTADDNFDVFITSTITISGLVWTDDTNRATEIELTDGVYTQVGDSAERYLGTITTTATAGRVDDTPMFRYVWNLCNQVYRRLYAKDSSSHAYNGAYRKWNNADLVRVDFVLGLNSPVQCCVWGYQNAGADGNFADIDIDVDAEAAADADFAGVWNFNVENVAGSGCGSKDIPAGKHYLMCIENGNHAASTFRSASLNGSLFA